MRKLPDRILNMMDDVHDADRMENRIYGFVNVGVLVRRVELPDGVIRRYIDQLCFYTREQNENKIYLLMKDGRLISEELPPDIKKRLQDAGIKNPFYSEKVEIRRIEQERERKTKTFKSEKSGKRST